MADVDTLIEDARTFASDSFDAASELVDQATSIISDLGGGVFFSGPVFADIAPPGEVEEIPAFDDVEFTVPDAPDEPTALELPDMTLPAAPENDAVKPVLAVLPTPSELRDLGVSAPVINTSFVFPEPPSALTDVIPAPVLATRTEPDAPQILLPVFSAIKPDDDISAPTDYAEQFEAAYRDQAPSMYAALDGQMDAMLTRYNPRYHEQLAALEERLATFMAGGTGLTPGVENAIYERSRGKLAAEHRRVRDTAYSDAAKRGFILPDGALNAAVNQSRQVAADNNARAAVEIAIKQAELEQQNIQFAVTTSASLRTATMQGVLSYHQNLVAINGQALDYAKAILNAAVQVYEALVRAFTAKLEAYKAEAAVYETQVRGVLAQVEVYSAQIRALEALTQVDLAQVTLYRTRIEALETLARVYQTQVEVVLGRASLEKMKIELYGEQVRAYSVEAQAKAAQWQGYSAAIGGQEAQMRAYGEEVRAYATEIDGYRAVVQAKTSEVQMKMSYNEGLVRQYLGAVEGYKAVVDATSKVVSTRLDQGRMVLYTYQAKMSAMEAHDRTVQNYYQIKAQAALEDARLVSSVAVSNAQIATDRIKATADTSIAGARVYESMASASLSGMNTLVTQSS